jgi:hypothetical protein
MNFGVINNLVCGKTMMMAKLMIICHYGFATWHAPPQAMPHILGFTQLEIYYHGYKF